MCEIRGGVLLFGATARTGCGGRGPKRLGAVYVLVEMRLRHCESNGERPSFFGKQRIRTGDWLSPHTRRIGNRIESAVRCTGFMVWK